MLLVRERSSVAIPSSNRKDFIFNLTKIWRISWFVLVFQLPYFLFAALTFTTFLFIEMRIGMWSELRAGGIAHSVQKSNDGLAIVMSGKLVCYAREGDVH